MGVYPNCKFAFLPPILPFPYPRLKFAFVFVMQDLPIPTHNQDAQAEGMNETVSLSKSLYNSQLLYSPTNVLIYETIGRNQSWCG